MWTFTSARAAAAAVDEEVAWSTGSDPPVGVARFREPSWDDDEMLFGIIISPCASWLTSGTDAPSGNANLVGVIGIGDVALEVVEGRAKALTGVASMASSFMIASDFRFAPGPVSMPARLKASSKAAERGGRAGTKEVERAFGGLDKALLTELAGEAGAEATLHCVTCSGVGGRAGKLGRAGVVCTTAVRDCVAW